MDHPLHLQHVVTEAGTLAVVDRLILGLDFLRHHQLDVSLACHLLVSVNGDVSLPQMLFSSSPSLLSNILGAYQEILSEVPRIVGLGFSSGKHNVRHHIETCCLPISMLPQCLDLQKYATMKAEFKNMEVADLFGGTICLGPWPFIWYPRLTALGGHVAISMGSTT